MSEIVTRLKCAHCETEFNDIYISFGYPEEDFVYKWKCRKCSEINEKLIYKMPTPQDALDKLIKQYCEKNNCTEEAVWELLNNKNK